MPRVIVVNGVDNLEKERMVKTLLALNTLFCVGKRAPFITVIAVDAAVVEKALTEPADSIANKRAASATAAAVKICGQSRLKVEKSILCSQFLF